MASRRAPLSNIPNGVNSPCRTAAVASTAVSKRSRSHSTVQQHDTRYGEPPPAKKQMLSRDYPEPRTPPSRQQRHIQIADGPAFPRRTGNTQITSLERKLLAAREKQHKAAMEEKAISESLETVRQWQKHYRKLFPTFVFYLESIPEEIRVRCSKQITLLGAREVRFFSKGVTHVVTTRPIPPEPEPGYTVDSSDHSVSTSGTRSSQRDQPNTINPSLLQRSTGFPSYATSIPPNGKFTFEASSWAGGRLQRNGQTGLHTGGGDGKRQQPSNVDVLFKAREMGMRIWALEKLQRMMTALFEDIGNTSPHLTHGHNTRSTAANAMVTGVITNREAQLSQLLREERLNGPTDRDPSVVTKDLIPFKGPFIYVRDMDEKVKPILMREYPKVANREDGAWPQFRCVSHGKCPFVDEVDHDKREKERQRDREEEEREKGEQQRHVAQRTRATVALEATKMAPPPPAAGRRAVAEENNQVETADSHQYEPQELKALESVKPTPETMEEQERVPKQSLYMNPSMAPARFFRGEPVASGVQPSNITSAIRSQMISSTAAAPGAKAGTTKEVYSLKRKILEKNGGSTTSTIPSRQTPDISGNPPAVRANTNPRVAKLRAQQRLGHIEGDLGRLEEEDDVQATVKPQAPKTKAKRDLKPGYCENCREKFDDFDEHVVSRNHRRFALNDRNWAELDALLSKLVRPLKDEEVDQYWD